MADFALPTDDSDIEPESDFELPTDEDILECRQKQSQWRCPCGCISEGSQLYILAEATRNQMKSLQRELLRQRAWQSLKDLKAAQDRQGDQRKGLVHMLPGSAAPVCRATWRRAMYVGSSTYQHLLGAVDEDGPPPDMRGHANKSMIRAPAEKQVDVEQFLHHAWRNIAMNLPDDVDADLVAEHVALAVPEEEAPAMAVPGNAEAVPGGRVNVAGDTVADREIAVTTRRYLRPMTKKEFHEMYVQWSSLAEPASLSCFKMYYLKHWHGKLRIATASAHGKCVTCEKLKAMRKKAVTSSDKESIRKAHAKHVSEVMADRQFDARCQELARASIFETNLDRKATQLNWDQDGCDQAKFKVPRNQAMAKNLQDAWRPQLGCYGFTFDGIGPMIFLSDQDLGKGADVILTITCRALEATRSGRDG